MTTQANMATTRGVHYVVALAVLLVMTGASFALSKLLAGSSSHWLALVIAAAKVMVVGYVFMHLREATFAIRLVALVALVFIALLCLGVVADVAFR